MPKNKFFIIFYLALTILYFGQRNIFGEDSGFGAIIVVPLLLLNILYLVKYAFSKNKTAFFNATIIFLIANTVYFFYERFFIQNVHTEVSVEFFKSVLLVITYGYPFYYFGITGKSLQNLLIIYALVMTFLSIGEFTAVHADTIIDRQDNLGYVFVSFTPFIFLLNRRKILMLGALLVLNIFVLMSAKRGAVICCGVVDALCLLYLSRDNNNRSLINKCLVLVALIYSASFLYDAISSNDFLLSRMDDMEDGRTSGRDTLYTAIWRGWLYKFNDVQMLFGRGFCAAPIVTGTQFAHNDWLELLADLGLFGVIIYYFFISAMLVQAIRYKGSLNIKYLLLSVWSIWFIQSMVSMSYMDADSYKYMMLFGYFSGYSIYRQTYERKKASMEELA